MLCLFLEDCFFILIVFWLVSFLFNTILWIKIEKTQKIYSRLLVVPFKKTEFSIFSNHALVVWLLADDNR